MPEKAKPLPCCEATFDLLLEGYAAFAILRDKNDQPIDYRFLEVNKQFESIVGVRRSEAIGKTLKQVLNTSPENWMDIFSSLQGGEVAERPEYSFRINNRYFRVSTLCPSKETLILLFLEVTAQKKAEETLKIHKILFEGAQDIILYIHSNGQIVDSNQRACEKYGYPKEKLLTKTIQNLRHPTTMLDYEYQMQQAETEGVVFESIHLRNDGSAFPVEVSARVADTEKGPLRIHIIRDITKRKESEAKIAWLARYDALTGIQNRGNFIIQLEQQIQRANRNKNRFALMLFDVDKFKLVNDQHGHGAGDIVLRHIAERVQGILRSTDQIGRLGGDEFVVLQTDIKGSTDVLELVKRIHAAASAPVVYHGIALQVSISVGICLFPEDAADVDNLLLCADRAMYAAKQKGGGQQAFSG